MPAPVTMRMAKRATLFGKFQRVRIDGKVHTVTDEPDWKHGRPIVLTIAEPLPFFLPG